jgi:hypothetical protein
MRSSSFYGLRTTRPPATRIAASTVAPATNNRQIGKATNHAEGNALAFRAARSTDQSVLAGHRHAYEAAGFFQCNE